MVPRRALLRCALLTVCAISLTRCAALRTSQQQCEDVIVRAAEIAIGSEEDLAELRKHLRDRTPGSPGAIAISSCQKHLTKQDIHCLLTYETMADFSACLSSPGAAKWQADVEQIKPAK